MKGKHLFGLVAAVSIVLASGFVFAHSLSVQEEGNTGGFDFSYAQMNELHEEMHGESLDRHMEEMGFDSFEDMQEHCKAMHENSEGMHEMMH